MFYWKKAYFNIDNFFDKEKSKTIGGLNITLIINNYNLEPVTDDSQYSTKIISGV